MVGERFPDDNYYQLKYKCGDYTCEVKFLSLIDGDTLVHNLRDFLAGCSWSEDCIKGILRLEDEDDIEEDNNEE